MIKKQNRMLSAAELSIYCEQISILLNGGIPLYEGTYIMYQEVEDKRLQKVMKVIDDQVKENVPLYMALDEAGCFPEYLIHMVEIGEMSGKLEEVMQSLAAYYERESIIKNEVKRVIV